jgi:hypothetical protein
VSTIARAASTNVAAAWKERSCDSELVMVTTGGSWRASRNGWLAQHRVGPGHDVDPDSTPKVVNICGPYFVG